MKIWILRPQWDTDLWAPWYDKAFGFIVRAETEEDARKLANEKTGDENWEGIDAWNNTKYTTCEPLLDAGEPEVILRDYAAA